MKQLDLDLQCHENISNYLLDKIDSDTWYQIWEVTSVRWASPIKLLVNFQVESDLIQTELDRIK